MKKRRIKRIRPSRKDVPIVAPAFLPGRRGAAGWHITEAGDSTPSTLTEAGIWNVPYGNTDHDKYTRLHETLHAAHSPLDRPTSFTTADGLLIEAKSVMLAEEVRIDGYARGKLSPEGMPQDIQEKAESVFRKLAVLYGQTGNPDYIEHAIKFFFASWMANPIDLLSNRFDAYTIPSLTEVQKDRVYQVDLIIRQIQEHLFYSFWPTQIDYLTRGEMIDWSETLRLAEYIQNIRDYIKKMDTGHGEGEDTGDGVPEDLKKLAAKAARAGHSKTKGIEEVHQKMRGQKPTPPNKVVWGKVTWRFPKLTLKLPGKKMMKSKWKATDMGVSPRNIHRLTIDGQVFGKRKREPAGSVLIDDSGSMHWSAREVARIIEAAPASIIAAYSGNRTLNEMVIIAKDGKWADPAAKGVRPHGGGNEIDLPGLEWLAEQPKPRIWVSDQEVVPLSGGYTSASKECLDFILANDINAVPDAKAAADVFEGKRAIYR